MTKQYLTKEKLEELKNELNDLKTVKRIEVGEKLKRAKELGDLSENSEYFEAREDQSRVESRIFELEGLLKDVELIKKPHSGSSEKGIVRVGSTVDVSKSGKKMKFFIIGSNETNPDEGYISNESPLGKAFLGKKSGDSVSVQVPSGKVEYKILSVD
ncbi:MAG: transcription elongation factor GreA [Minisyncoccota bacterium]